MQLCSLGSAAQSFSCAFLQARGSLSRGYWSANTKDKDQIPQPVAPELCKIISLL